MADMDQGIKRLIQLFPGELIAFAKPGVEYISPAPTDVAMERQLILDTLYRARYHGLDCMVNFEAQVDVSRDVPRRMAEYAGRVKTIYHLPLFSIILWLKQKGPVPQPPYEEWLDDYFVSSHNFINIEVYRLSAEQTLASGPIALLPLIPLMEGATEATDVTAMQKIAQSLPSELQQSASELLAVFIARQFNDKDLAKQIYRRIYMSTELLEESPLYQEAIEKGLERGIPKGIEQGVLQAKRDDIRLLLEKRFGPLDAPLITVIESANLDTLKAIFLDAISDSLEHIRTHIQELSADTPQQPT